VSFVSAGKLGESLGDATLTNFLSMGRGGQQSLVIFNKSILDFAGLAKGNPNQKRLCTLMIFLPQNMQFHFWLFVVFEILRIF
jgi:hypothetical protein